MSEPNSGDFENFPRADLSLRIGRRQLFLTTAIESRARNKLLDGGNTFKLSALGSMPDELLGLMTPRPVEGYELAVSGGFCVARQPAGSRPIRLFPADSPARSVFARFNGQVMLEAIARDVAVEHNWEPARAFAYVRGVFLHLVTLGLCWPK